jgi:hypothetical protein
MMPTTSPVPSLSNTLSSTGVPPGYTVEPVKLEEHVEATYFTLRSGIAILGFALPILLPVGAKIARDVPLQPSLSAYYFAGAGAMRNEFVGILVTVGAFLYLYKGFSRSENVALNLAGIFAVCIALVPMPWNCGTTCSPVSVHGTAAVLFFLCIAYVCLFRAMDTLSLLDDPQRVARYKRSYRILGASMVISPVAALLVNALLQRRGEESLGVFFIEGFAVWVFAAYWSVKSRELRETSAERQAFEGKVVRVKAHRRWLPDNAAIIKR